MSAYVDDSWREVFEAPADVELRVPEQYPTITSAIKALQPGMMSRILISPGIYREAVTIHKTGNLRLDAPKGGVFITGADLWNGQASLPDAEYPDGWPTGERGGAPKHPHWLRSRVLMFVHGQRLRQVFHPDRVSLGTYYAGPDYFDVRYLRDDSPAVEMATRPYALRIQDSSYVYVGPGITLQRTTPSRLNGGAGLEVWNSDHIWLDGVRTQDNNYCGANIHRCHHVGGTVYADRNGLSGAVISFVRDSGLRVIAVNNFWRGFRAGFQEWMAGGCKVLRFRTGYCTIVAEKNKGRGAWFDTDVSNVNVWAHCFDNFSDGVMIEACQGPINLNGFIARNIRHGLVLRGSSQVTLENLSITKNHTAAVAFGGPATGRTVIACPFAMTMDKFRPGNGGNLIKIPTGHNIHWKHVRLRGTPPWVYLDEWSRTHGKRGVEDAWWDLPGAQIDHVELHT